MIYDFAWHPHKVVINLWSPSQSSDYLCRPHKVVIISGHHHTDVINSGHPHKVIITSSHLLHSSDNLCSLLIQWWLPLGSLTQ